MDDSPAAPFPETRYSALDAIRGGDGERRRRALETLAAMYWRPVYGYLRLRWRLPHEEASDLTQEFFVLLVRDDLLARFDRRRARLRTFLRGCVDGVAANERRSARRQKRGGGQPDLRFDFDEVRAEFERAGNVSRSPEELFDQEWARALLTLAVRTLEDECRRAGKADHFALLEHYDLSGASSSYAEMAKRFRLSATDVTNRLAWARRRLRAVALDLLRQSTASDDEFRSEARALFGVEAK